MKKQLLLFIAVFFFQIASYAQYYTFSKSTAAYTEISGTTLTNGEFGEFDVFKIKLPFTFNLFGEDFDTLYTTIGYASFTYEILEYNGEPITNMSGYELSVFDSFDKQGFDSSSIKYQTTGSVGNRIVKVQWKGISFESDTTGKDYANGQLWLYEKDFKVEYHYGPTSIQNSETLYGTQGGFIVAILNQDGSDGYILTGDAKNPVSHTPAGTPPPAVVNPNTAGMVYTFSKSASTPVLPSSVKEKIIVSPNPFSDYIQIQNQSELRFSEVSIYNMQGALIQRVQGDVTSINTAGLAPGIYELIITTPQGSMVEKLVK